MKKSILIGGIVVLMFGGLIAQRSSSSEAKSEEGAEENKKNVKVVTLDSDYENTTTYRGLVKGATEVHLAPKAQGRVTHIYKEVGEKVWRGQLLATIDGSELWAQTNVAQAGFNMAKDASKKTDRFFKKQESQAKKGRDLAKDGYEMAKKSGDQEKIAQAKANYEMAKKAVDVAKEGRELQVKIAKGQQNVAWSQVQAAQTMASNTQLRAPFSGVIAQANVEIGSLVSPQMPMFLIVGNDGQEIEVSVDSDQLKSLTVGQEIKIKSDKGEEIQAKIATISPMVDTHNRKGLVKISLPKNNEFTLGEYVNVLLPSKNESDVVTIPRQALVRMYHDTFVFVVKADVAHRQVVKIGEDLGDNIAITEGVNSGDKIVIEGQQFIEDNDSVVVVSNT